jgi:uncharacterized SAM-binding protein YcdF (DUF218 family)
MWCKGCLAAVAVVVVSGLVVGWVSLRNLGAFLDVTQEPILADAIVVMGGEGGRYTRTQHALELYKAGMSPTVVFSGGTLLASGLECSSTGLSLDAAERLGLPPEAMVISGEAQSTHDEAENIARLAEENNWQSLLLVTDLFHTRRSLQVMRYAMPERVIYASAPEDPRFRADRWWENEHGLVFAINEAIKLAFYWKEYGIRPFG